MTAGKIMLVGIGPGSTEHMTARARAAIAEADTIIGYVTYIKLVADPHRRQGDHPQVHDRRAGPRHRSAGARPPGQEGGAHLFGRCGRVRHGRAHV